MKEQVHIRFSVMSEAEQLFEIIYAFLVHKSLSKSTWLVSMIQIKPGSLGYKAEGRLGTKVVYSLTIQVHDKKQLWID